jgi:hypothetical protein
MSKLSSDARRSIDKATKKFEGEVEDRVRRIAMNPKVSKVRDGVKKVKDKVKAIYKEKASKVKAEWGGFVEDARQSSRGISGRIQLKMSRFKQRVKEFYQERLVGPTTSYSCIGHQMRNFVLSSVLLQHVAFSVLLWRHWDKTEAASMEPTSKYALLGLVGLYWIFALISMFKRNAPQWLLYVCMSLVLVHMAPFQIVAFDFLLLLLTIALATVSVFDIYHRLYKSCLVVERSVLQDHLFMSLQVTLLFLHLSSAPLVTLLTTLVAIFTWRDFVSFFQLQRGQHVLSQAWQLLQNQTHKWVAISIANLAWIFFSVKFLGSLMPFSLLHPHTLSASTPSLFFLAAELTVFHCCILIKYEIRYPTEEEDSNQNAVNNAPHHHNHHHHHLHHNQHRNPAAPLLAPVAQHDPNIPAPPPLPPQWIAQQRQRQMQQQHRLRQLQQAAASAASATGSEESGPNLTLLHPTVYWHYVWILGVFCDFLMGLLDRLGFDGISQSLSLVLPVVVLVAVLPIQIHYWNNKWNYDIDPCNSITPHVH